jgi:hypothetical protein
MAFLSPWTKRPWRSPKGKPCQAGPARENRAAAAGNGPASHITPFQGGHRLIWLIGVASAWPARDRRRSEPWLHRADGRSGGVRGWSPATGRPGRGGIAAFSQVWSVGRGQCLADSSPMGLHSAPAQLRAPATRTPYPWLSPRGRAVRRQCVAITRPGRKRDDPATHSHHANSMGAEATGSTSGCCGAKRRPVTIAVTDTKNGETFEVPISEGERALEVFRHPYAYAARPQHRCVPIAVSHSS